jgi:hypothetical protein
MPAGFLVLAASISFFAMPRPLEAQFPIRQMPDRPASNPLVRPVDGPVNPRAHAGPNPGAITATPPLPAVARIVVPEKDGISYGSGTLVDVRGQFGLVVSNWHVVRDAAGPITVEFPDGFKSPAEVVKTDKDWDLAALSIYRPHAAPVPVTAAAPQPGELLTIAGYGSGQWRMTGGRCTQYLSPGVEFPHEMVELAAEARQGDSGGPILNQRGELAGVLFGSGPGYTSGSYGGRVLKFLAAVVPGGSLGSDGAVPSSAETGQGLASLEPSRPANSYQPATPPISPPPQATALHENRSPTPELARNAEPMSPKSNETAALTPALKPTADPLLSPPPRREVADRFGSSSQTPLADEVDPRVAVVPSRLDLNSMPLDRGIVHPANQTIAVATAPLAPRTVATAPAGELDHVPADRLLAIVWKQFAGNTVFDQAKAVLAIIGGLTLIVVFLRFGSTKERERDEE